MAATTGSHFNPVIRSGMVADHHARAKDRTYPMLLRYLLLVAATVGIGLLAYIIISFMLLIEEDEKQRRESINKLATRDAMNRTRLKLMPVLRPLGLKRVRIDSQTTLRRNRYRRLGMLVRLPRMITIRSKND